MAPGLFKKTMVYLGLVDDEYEDYEDYEPRSVPAPRASARHAVEDLDSPVPVASSSGSIRPFTREEGAPSSTPGGGAGARPVVVRPVPSDATRVNVVAPTQFADARQIADRLMGNQPVIVNLQVADRELMRRMIDFCSGVAYSLGGKMERVADKVFLITPSNVRVSAEERQRLQDNGLLEP
jgi:cell division inhibitor SepF